MRLPGTRTLMTFMASLLVPLPVVGVLPSDTHSYGPIDHVIVIMQSGHSFDNYFGTRPGVDGLPLSGCQPVAVGAQGCQKPFHLPSGQARYGLTDTLRVTKKAIDGGKMDGFITAQPNSIIGSVAMGYLDGSDLPYYWSLADRFTLFDHFYASSQAGALPNRLISMAGTDAGISSNSLSGDITSPTVFDLLDKAKLPWKYYLQGYKGPSQAPSPGQVIKAPVLAMPSITATADRARIVDTSQYFVDMAKGQLPAVSYVSGTVSSERSPQNPAQGMAFVQSLINALMQSPEWQHTALLLTYDDSGGWYDHSKPPTVGGTTLGIRVPTLLVSPYAKSGYVDSGQLDTASIPAFIEQVFRLPTLPSQEASSGSVLSAMDLSQPPISPAIGPAQGAAAVIPRPAVATIYLLYLGALTIAAILILLAFRRYRRQDLPPSTPDAPEVPA